MGNFFNNEPQILRYISRKKNVNLKTGFLRLFFWKLIEVKRTIEIPSANFGYPVQAFWFLVPKYSNYLEFQSFDYEYT